jgi:hypothetical protein
MKTVLKHAFFKKNLRKSITHPPGVREKLKPRRFDNLDWPTKSGVVTLFIKIVISKLHLDQLLITIMCNISLQDFILAGFP